MKIRFLLNGRRGETDRREVSGEVAKVNARTCWVRVDGKLVKRKYRRDLVDPADVPRLAAKWASDRVVAALLAVPRPAIFADCEMVADGLDRTLAAEVH